MQQLNNSNLKTNLPSEVERYLNKYSLTTWQMEGCALDNINCIVVIPAIAEYENIRTLISSLAENENFFLKKH
ncbi:MAG: hypothetical protein NTX22_08190 [Ignavibacteriales bacterium]|nr:hypothetical protein [Ignavibacteriales bacterium]